MSGFTINKTCPSDDAFQPHLALALILALRCYVNRNHKKTVMHRGHKGHLSTLQMMKLYVCAENNIEMCRIVVPHLNTQETIEW